MTKTEAGLIIRCQNAVHWTTKNHDAHWVSLIGDREVSGGPSLQKHGLVQWREGNKQNADQYFDAIRWFTS